MSSVVLFINRQSPFWGLMRLLIKFLMTATSINISSETLATAESF